MHLSIVLAVCFFLACSNAASIRSRSVFRPEGFRKFYAGHSRKDLSKGIVVPLSRGLHTARRFRRDANSAGSPLTAVALNLLADVTVGNQPFKLLVDTGSSDTWVPTGNFSCVDAKEKPTCQKTCNIPTLYTQPAGVSAVPGVHLDQSYASGEFVVGPMVLETVSVGGFTAQNAQIGAVDEVFWKGDGVNSGLLGLSSRAQTTARDANQKRAVYDPVFQKMVQQNVTKPFFSMSIDIVDSGPAGYLVFGGLPPVAHDDTFTTIPIIKKTSSFQGPLPSPQVVDYIVPVQSFTVGGKEITMKNLEMVVDSGTFANIVPDDLANQINDQWTPPAIFNQEKGLFAIDCAATAPDVGVTLKGTKFNMLSKAAVQKNGTNCFSAWTGGGAIGDQGAIFLLGDVFMKSVVSVFDLGTAEMHFAARV